MRNKIQQNKITRRTFLAGTLITTGTAGILTKGCLTDPKSKCLTPHQTMSPVKNQTLDIHVHLFGKGDNQSGCILSKKILNGWTFKLLCLKLGIPRKGKSLDKSYELALAGILEESGLDKALILAQDAVYSRNGKPDWKRTPIYVPNDYLFKVTKRHPKTMIPCISINPDREDALDELERWVEKGARVLKIHPPIQGVDISKKKHKDFFRKCAEHHVIVMVHTGHEHSSPVIDIKLASPLKLELALDQGCKVVACHCGTGWPTDPIDMLPDFLKLLKKYNNLWGDTSVLGTPGRVRDVSRLLSVPHARERLLHGSDFPFPCVPISFKDITGEKKANQLHKIPNSIKQDLALKEAWGIGIESSKRAHKLICR